MLPVLVRPWGFPIHTYGVLGALGFLVIAAFGLARSRRFGASPDRVVDVIFWTSLAAVVGSRALYVLQNPDDFTSWTGWLNLRTGGLVFYGALLTGLPVAGLLMWRFKLPVFKLMDAFATGFPLAHAITRMGCFAAGCCYGRPTTLPWGVRFSDPLAPGPHGVPLHPTQLYEVGFNLLIFVVVNWFYRRKRFDGQVMLLYLVLYAIMRSINEVFRGDVERGFFLEGVLGQAVSTSQALSVVVIAGGVAVCWWGARQWRQAGAAEE